MTDPQIPSSAPDEGVLGSIMAALRRINPFQRIGDEIAAAGQPPKPADGLLKGRSTDVFNENVRILVGKGIPEAEAVKLAQKRMMEQ